MIRWHVENALHIAGFSRRNRARARGNMDPPAKQKTHMEYRSAVSRLEAAIARGKIKFDRAVRPQYAISLGRGDPRVLANQTLHLVQGTYTERVRFLRSSRPLPKSELGKAPSYARVRLVSELPWTMLCLPRRRVPRFTLSNRELHRHFEAFGLRHRRQSYSLHLA